MKKLIILLLSLNFVISTAAFAINEETDGAKDPVSTEKTQAAATQSGAGCEECTKYANQVGRFTNTTEKNPCFGTPEGQVCAKATKQENDSGNATAGSK